MRGILISITHECELTDVYMEIDAKLNTIRNSLMCNLLFHLNLLFQVSYIFFMNINNF